MLRTLISTVSVLALCALGIAQESDEKLEFAPGSQGVIKAPIMEIIDRAKAQGEALSKSLHVQKANDFGRKLDIDELRKRALSNERVRKLLGADGGEPDAAAIQARYSNQRAFILVSFSMPEQSLKAVMVEADRFNMPILMRGFVKNDVVATQTAIQRVFGDDAESIGFNIDPTMFTRFNVEAVPQVIVVADELQPCETQGCAGDIPPPHDVVKGNIPVEAALRIIADGDGDASAQARAILGGNG